MTTFSDEMAELELDRMAIVLHEELGSGEFGKVFRAEIEVTEQETIQVAVKFISGDISAADLTQFYKEAKRMKNLVHSNIIQLLGVCFQSSPFCIAMEYMDSGDLHHYLQKNYAESGKQIGVRFDTIKLLEFCVQIASALSYLHTIKYVHRDIAARNVLVNSNGVLKLSDFGLSRNLYVSEVSSP